MNAIAKTIAVDGVSNVLCSQRLHVLIARYAGQVDALERQVKDLMNKL